MPFKFSK